MRAARLLLPLVFVAAAGGLALAVDADATAAALLLVLAVAASALLGRIAGVMAAALGSAALIYGFLEPRGELSVTGRDGLTAFVTFVLVAVLVGTLVRRSAELREQAERRERETRQRDELERSLRLDAEIARTRAAFFAAAGHNLRTPLASIAASANALSDAGETLSPEDRHDLIAAIRDESDRLSRLIAKILAASRIRAGELHVDRQDVDLAGLAQAAVRRLGPLAAGHRVTLDVPPSLGDLHLDPTMVEQILLNLLENAVQRAPVDTDVHVTAAVVPDGVEMRVVDHGPGIPPDARDAVFEEFVRLDASPDSEGTGLGLAIVRALATAQGGRAWCDETPGGGATMVVWFPSSRATSNGAEGSPVEVAP